MTVVPACQSNRSTGRQCVVGTLRAPSRRFEHGHHHVNGNRYCLTCVDRFTLWVKCFPMTDVKAMTVARTFYTGWLTRSGMPLRITTDQCRQLESHSFKALCHLTGTTNFRMSVFINSSRQETVVVPKLYQQYFTASECHLNMISHHHQPSSSLENLCVSRVSSSQAQPEIKTIFLVSYRTCDAKQRRDSSVEYMLGHLLDVCRD